MITLIALIAIIYLALQLLRSGPSLSFPRASSIKNAERLPDRCLFIVQPILSGDPFLGKRLKSNLENLESQSFLWLVDDEDLEAKRITTKLKDTHPNTDLHIEICPPCPELINPKLWKLQRAAKRATSSFFCVLDDDTLLPASSAAALVTEASMHTIATGLPCYQDDGTTASGLLAQFVNNNSIFTYLGTTKLLHPFTLNGMGYVLDSKALHALGDFSPILHEMTDDLALATLVLKNRGTICQSSAPLIVDTKVLSLSHYFRLMHRWYLFTLLLLKKQQRSSRIIIFSLHGAPPVLLVILFMLTLYAATPEAVITLLALLAVRGIILTLMLHHFFHRHLHRPLLSILSEIFQPVHLVHALVSHTIHWRTRRYHVRDTSDFSSI